MDIKKKILKTLEKINRITSEEVAGMCKVTRQAAHSHLADLVADKKLLRIGKTRGAYYVRYSKKLLNEQRGKGKSLNMVLINKKLEEDKVYERIKRKIALIGDLRKNVQDILYYAFTEMLNNAIEHSGSRKISIVFNVSPEKATFEVKDRGIGIFNNIKRKYGLEDEYEAVEELLKGKTTTMPDKHSGEGIFFTSKAADIFEIKSAGTRLVIDNVNNDVFVEEVRAVVGTSVFFAVKISSKLCLEEIFREYTSENYEFQKTKIRIKLYEKGVEYVSRSQARRVVLGLDQFKRIILDFKGITGIGQAFADEIFRVFQKNHPEIKIEAVNCLKAVDFMIKRAGKYEASLLSPDLNF